MVVGREDYLTVHDSLLEEIKGVPDPLLVEVVDFVRFLKAQKAQERLETAVLTEPMLVKDWLRPEEEHAWRDL